MKVFRSSIIVGAALLIAATASAQSQKTLDRERIDQLAKEAAQRFAAEQTPTPPPQMPAIPGLNTGPVVNLTIDEAVRRGAENNLDIAVDRLNPETFDLSLVSLRAVYEPTLTSLFGKNNRTNLPTNTLTGGTRVTNDTLNANGGATQAFKWGGGNYSMSFNNSKAVTNSANANFNPQFQSSFSATVTQPVLRNFKIDNTRQQILTTEISRRSSEIQLHATTYNTLANVRNAYWDLVFAIEAVNVAKQSLTLAQKLVDDNNVRVEVGTMAPIDVIQAQAQAATSQQQLVTAQATARTAELALKRLIVSGTDDPLWNSPINPTDRPTGTSDMSGPLDVAGAVRTALEHRTDVQQARNTLDISDITLKYQRNQTLPQIDIVGSYGLQGIGGTQYVREDPRKTDSPIISQTTGNYFDALSVLGGRNYPLWTLQMNVSYPIGTSSTEAQYARSKIQLNQARAQLKSLELQIATDVTNAALTAQSNVEAVQAATAARELSQKRLEAAQSKFEVGMATNFEVIQAQRDLRDAQNSELRAILNYRKSIVEFERVQNTGTRTVTAVGR